MLPLPGQMALSHSLTLAALGFLVLKYSLIIVPVFQGVGGE